MEQNIGAENTPIEQTTGLEQLIALEEMQREKASAGDLYTAFFRIGLCTFGGDRAMLPQIARVCGQEHEWLTAEELAEAEEVAGAVPGPMAFCLAAYIGWKQAGFGGALAGALGLVTPGIIIIYLISLFLDTLLGFTVISRAFRGLQAAVGILILDAAFSMLWRMEKKLLPIVVFFGTAILMLAATLRSIHLSVVTLLLAAAALSLGIYGARGAFGEEEEEKKPAGKDGKPAGKSGGAKKAKADAEPAEDLDPKAAKKAARKGAKADKKAAQKEAKAGKKAAQKEAKAAKAAKKAEKAGKKKGGKGK